MDGAEVVNLFCCCVITDSRPSMQSSASNPSSAQLTLPCSECYPREAVFNTASRTERSSRELT